MSKTKIKLSPSGKHIVGCYSECEELYNPNCTRLIPSPYVRCQEHRNDLAVKDNVVEYLEFDEVEIME